MRRSCAWKELTKTCTMPRHARDLLMIRTRVAGALGARKQAREKRFPDACRSPRFEFSFPRHPLFFSGRAPAGFSLAFLTLNSDTVFSLPSLSPFSLLSLPSLSPFSLLSLPSLSFSLPSLSPFSLSPPFFSAPSPRALLLSAATTTTPQDEEERALFHVPRPRARRGDEGAADGEFVSRVVSSAA